MKIFPPPVLFNFHRQLPPTVINLGQSRGVWENCLYDALEREGAVRIGTLCQFLDFFHFAFGRSVASYQFSQKLPTSFFSQCHS